MNAPTLHILTFGCRVNQYESEAMLARLTYRVAADAKDADVVILNGCSVTGLAEKKARQAARKIRRESPGVRILLTGCLADAVEQGVARFDEADAIVGNAWKPYIEQVVSSLWDGTALQPSPPAPVSLDAERTLGPAARVRAYLKVQDGCSGVCTYCHPTRLRGASRSKTLAAAVAEAAQLCASGFPELVLTGINLAEYASPDGDLADLVGRLLVLPDLRRLRLASINPSGITPRLLRVFEKDRRACRHFHIPLQSGSDTILRRMARQTTRAQYLDRIDVIRRTLPDATFGTDIIVGFPGETDTDFLETRGIVERVGFINLHAFRFSVRPGTAAQRLDGAVSGDVKRQRADQLDECWKATLAPLLDARVGKTEHVLTEACHDGHGYGYTSDYIHVTYTTSQDVPIGKLRPVRITGRTAISLEGLDEHPTDTS